MMEQTITTTTTMATDNLLQQTQLWNIITINTRGLQDTCKRETWFTYLASQTYHIIVHTETNSKTHDAFTWKISNFKSWWHNCESQTVGQGIGISITNNLADRVFKVQTWAGRIISLDLSFPHKHYLRIIALYFPASTQTGKHKISNIIKKLITEATQKQWHIITVGDFNAVTNPQVDKSQTNKATLHHSRPTSDIIRNLIHNQHIDTFRELHPYSKQFTWINTRLHHSRIDQIWINPSQHWLLLQADIQVKVLSD
jgi:exonuclease III